MCDGVAHLIIGISKVKYHIITLGINSYLYN